VTAGLLILSALIFAVGAILYTGREFFHWPAAQSRTYLYWERGLVNAAAMLNVVGLAMLEGILRDAGDPLIARAGLTALLIGVVLVIVAEAHWLHDQTWIGTLVRSYVVLAFLAEAAFGGALLVTGLLPAWAGWATILFNVGWLIVLVRASDPYYPVLHHTAPLLIGILLLLRG
jgi:hypothetical protein